MALNVEKMEIGSATITFRLDIKDLKQGRLGYNPETLVLRGYPLDRRLCVYTYVTKYLKRTLDIRGKEKRFILTTMKPYKAASRDTISQWVKRVLKEAGINMNVFKPGNTRAATVSKAASKGARIDDIMKGAGWARESTFTKWYRKDVKRDKGLEKYVLG